MALRTEFSVYKVDENMISVQPDRGGSLKRRALIEYDCTMAYKLRTKDIGCLYVIRKVDWNLLSTILSELFSSVCCFVE
jgi:hypothetical protein